VKEKKKTTEEDKRERPVEREEKRTYLKYPSHYAGGGALLHIIAWKGPFNWGKEEETRGFRGGG